MINFNDQSSLFKLIGNSLNKKIECFVIGGSAMMFYGAKAETKDVDLVFMNKDDMDDVVKALYDIGFNEKESIIKIFRRYEAAKNKPVMMIKDDIRFDLFLKEIITLKMSKTIIDRVKETHEFNNLII